MKFTLLFSYLAGSLGCLSVAALPSPPTKAHTLPRLHKSGTFYCPVSDKEFARRWQSTGSTISGSHPPWTNYSPKPSDFSHAGAMYVFADDIVAKRWGNNQADQDGSKRYHLIKLRYDPTSAVLPLHTHSFEEADQAWRKFVSTSYSTGSTQFDRVTVTRFDRVAGIGTHLAPIAPASPHHDFDVVEGPLSTRASRGRPGDHMSVYLDRSGHMVWQAAFSGVNAMSTLKIVGITVEQVPTIPADARRDPPFGFF